jgi:hypothetical protein
MKSDVEWYRSGHKHGWEAGYAMAMTKRLRYQWVKLFWFIVAGTFVGCTEYDLESKSKLTPAPGPRSSVLNLVKVSKEPGVNPQTIHSQQLVENLRRGLISPSALNRTLTFSLNPQSGGAGVTRRTFIWLSGLKWKFVWMAERSWRSSPSCERSSLKTGGAAMRPFSFKRSNALTQVCNAALWFRLSHRKHCYLKLSRIGTVSSIDP